VEQTASFGYWLRRRRKVFDLTQAALARQIGCATVTIRKIEADELRPSTQIAERLAACLEVSPSERSRFIKAARAELAVDRLAPPTDLAGPPNEEAAEPAPAQVHLDQPDWPTGTVTFLFADIENNTTLWQQHQAAMATAMAHYHDLLSQAVARHNGVVFKTTNDRMCAAFADAPNALAAALEVQRLVRNARWEPIDALPVRSVLHTGTAEPRDGDYMGLPLVHSESLLAAGHGGQILLSQVTWQLVRDALPEELELRDLGRHRLKDLNHFERIFQLVAADLPADFPPLTTLDHLTNVPVQLTSFIGREQAIASACATLRRADVRLLTLTGPGGMGKTRMGIKLATSLLADFDDGVCFVGLAALHAPELVAPTIAKTLGVIGAEGRSPIIRLTEWLRRKQMLLLLDNFEHLAAAAPLVSEILAACRHVKILVTSRMPLRLYGEYEVEVPPLTLPDLSQAPAAEQFIQYEAIRLFVARAQAVKPDFALTDGNARAIAELCHRLDGLPLAIEIVAVYSKLFPPRDLLARLAHRQVLLMEGARNGPARHQTLRSTIDWSYHLLSKHDQELFRWLGVFAGGCTLAALEEVYARPAAQPSQHAMHQAPAPVADSLLERLAALVDRSLLQHVELDDGETRFVMLETIREYALDKLAANGESQLIRQQHAYVFLAFAEDAQPETHRAHRATWFDRLEREHDNLRAALGWFLEAGQLEPGLWLAGMLLEFWTVRGYFSEGRRWLEQLLAQPTEPTPARARALLGAGVLAYRQADYQIASERFSAAQEIFRECGDQCGVADVLINMGELAHAQDDHARARACFEESLALYRALADTQGVARTLNGLGAVARNHGDYATARALVEESLALYRELDNKVGVAWALYRLGILAYHQGHAALERACYEESLVIRRELGDKWGMAYSLLNLGYAAANQGRYALAQARYEESLTLCQELEDRKGVASVLVNLGELARLQGHDRQAAEYYEESLALFRDLGDNLVIALLLHNLGQVAHRRGEHERAWALFRESLKLYWGLKNRVGIASCLAGLAGAGASMQRTAWAAQLLGAVEQSLVVSEENLEVVDQAEYDRNVALVRRRLDPAVYAAAWACGRAMGLEEAVELALHGDRSLQAVLSGC
jgi:predicted ATPase/class 3 adenylate cyclase